jgi:hypothetical protein
MRSSSLLTIGAVATATVLALAPSALAGDGGLTPGQKLSMGQPGSLAVGDFNGDGRPDLAVAAHAEGTTNGLVKVRLADGNGGFTAAPDVLGGQRPRSVAVADFNADGKDDLAIVNTADRDVSVRLGYGTGEFFYGLPDVDLGGKNPGAIVTGDFNADNREDLAVATADIATGTSAVAIRLNKLNNGVTTFVDAPSLPGHVNALAVGDFNGDSIEDLAAGSASPAEHDRIFLGTGGGAFATPKDIPFPTASVGERALAVGDVDADGGQDLISVHRDAVYLRRGLGSGASTLDFPLTGQHAAVAIGDLDADGNEDLVIADYDQGAVHVRLGDGDGGFAGGAPILAGSGFTDIAIADFDGDGNDDVALADAVANNVTLLRGTGDPALAGNLLVNGGFEGARSATNPDDAPAVPGWDRTGGMTFIRYGSAAHAFVPSRIASARYATGGNNLLWGGKSASTGGVTAAFQTVDVSAHAPAIDGGASTVELSAWLGGALNVPDTMSVRADFLTASGATLGTVSTGSVTAADRGNLTTLQRRHGEAKVPVGTRRIRVTVTSVDDDKSYSSATADNVKLTLQPGPPLPTDGGTQSGGGGAGEGGGGAGGGADSATDRTAPVIGRVTLRPSTFARRRGTKARFTLSEPATVKLRIERRRAGRKARYARVRTLTRRGVQGANRFAISARRLRSGTYRLRVVAVDAAGNRTTAPARRFRVTR